MAISRRIESGPKIERILARIPGAIPAQSTERGSTLSDRKCGSAGNDGDAAGSTVVSKASNGRSDREDPGGESPVTHGGSLMSKV